MELPKRKQIRFDELDYNRGSFHIVVCSDNRKCIFSDIVIGQGLCSCRLTDIGKIVETELNNLPLRYTNIKIPKYCIMPNHIHFIVDINKTTSETKCDITAGRQEQSPCPITCGSVLCSFKSLATKKANENDRTPGRKIFQGRYYVHLIQDIKEYVNICKYIDENPLHWKEDKYNIT